MKVLFVCSAGMSSAIAVNALKKESIERNDEYEVFAVGSSELENELKNGWDVVMIAPQIRHRFKDLKEIANEAGVPCDLIEPMAYSPLGGKKLYEQVKKIIVK